MISGTSDIRHPTSDIPRAWTCFLALCGLSLFFAGCGGKDGTQSTATQPTAAPVDREAEQGPVQLRVHLDRDRAAVPEQLTLTMTAEADPGVEVKMPDYENMVGDFAIATVEKIDPTSQPATTAAEESQRLRWENRYTLDTNLPGTLSLPEIKVAFVDRRERLDGSQTEVEDTVSCPPIQVTVASTMRDAKDPVTVPLPLPYRVILWTLAAFAAAAGIGWFVRWWRRRPARALIPRAKPIIPHEWALAELDMLMAEGLIDRGLIQDFYYRINAIVRRYIELRFGLMAAEQTSEEFIRALQYSNVLRSAHKELLHQFTNACDPVKYARHKPAATDIEWVNVTARNFVLETAANGTQGDDETPDDPETPEGRKTENESLFPSPS